MKTGAATVRGRRPEAAGCLEAGSALATSDPPLEELLISVVAGLLEDSLHVAVGTSSPIPGAGALLARALRSADGSVETSKRGRAPTQKASQAGTAVGRPHRSQGLRVSILGSRRHQAMTNGGVELFDLAATGRIDAFFLGGGQIDAHANINLVGVGKYPECSPRWPGSFGSPYMYALVRKVILFRQEHSRRVFVPRVDFVSASGSSPPGTYRPGGPFALLTGLCLFRFDRERGRFVLRSIHPGHTLEEVRDQTGFDVDLDPGWTTTRSPSHASVALMRSLVRDQIAETYPAFARQWTASIDKSKGGVKDHRGQGDRPPRSLADRASGHAAT